MDQNLNLDAVKDDFYAEKAKKFRRFKWISLIFLAVFLVFGLVAFRSEITLENVRYLIKYISFDGSGSMAQQGAVIRYDSDSSNRYAVYRGDLVVVNNGGVSLFDSAGNLTMSDSFSMSNPVVASGGKYLAVYDLGGYYLKLYNSFSLLFEISFEYIIQSVAVNDNGYFCVATSDRSYQAALLVYNDDFQQVYKWLSSDKFIQDCTINSANLVTVTALHTENGELCSEAIGLEIGLDGAAFTVPLSDELPLAVYSQDRKSSLILTDRSFSRLEEGKKTASCSFQEDAIDLFAIGTDFSAVAQNELLVGVNYKVRIFDRALAEVGSLNLSNAILDMKTEGENVFLMTRNTFYRIRDGKEITEYPMDGDQTAFVLLSGNTVVLCSEKSARIMILG